MSGGARDPYTVRGTVDVQLGPGARAKIGGNVESIERVLKVAGEIWMAVRASGVAPEDAEGSAELLKDLGAEYKDFATSFPLALRWMVLSREYDAAAFEKFLRSEHVKAMYKDRHEFMAAQGEYLVTLYKALHPKASARQLTRYRAAVAKSLKEDDEWFMAARDEADAELKRIDQEVDAERRALLREHLERLKATRAAASESPREK
jgi:hypothetical protein